MTLAARHRHVLPGIALAGAACLLITVLLRATALTASVFPDVPDTHPYADVIEVMKRDGIFIGRPDGTFGPDTNINRAEITVIILRARGGLFTCSAQPFPDVSLDDWFGPAVCAAKEEGTLGGYPNGFFLPAQPVTFAELARIAAGAFRLSMGAETEPWYARYVQALQERGAIPSSIRDLGQKPTRGEVAYVLTKILHPEFIDRETRLRMERESREQFLSQPVVQPAPALTPIQQRVQPAAPAAASSQPSRSSAASQSQPAPTNTSSAASSQGQAQPGTSSSSNASKASSSAASPAAPVTPTPTPAPAPAPNPAPPVVAACQNFTSETPKAEYPVGEYPSSLAIADLNGDGRRDLVTANSRSATVSVLLKKSDGTFEGKIDYPVGSYPTSAAIGDLNGDGRPDIAVANSGNVSVLLNAGNGTFMPKADYPGGPGTLSVATGDLDGDGKPDLAIANTAGVSVLLNLGNGTFGPKKDYLVTGSYLSTFVTIGDLNGDGKADIAATANYPTPEKDPIGFVSLLLNTGNGTFGETVTLVAMEPTTAVAIGDFNKDGKPDVASVGSRRSSQVNWHDSSLTIFMKENGTFRRTETYALGGQPSYSVAIGDLNGDTWPDIATGGTGPYSYASAFYNKRDGTFGGGGGVSVGAANASVVIDDITGDGRPDLAVASMVTDMYRTIFRGAVTVLTNNCPATP